MNVKMSVFISDVKYSVCVTKIEPQAGAAEDKHIPNYL